MNDGNPLVRANRETRTEARFVKDATVIRFALVGLVSTSTDFILFVALATLGVPVALANIASYLTSLFFNFTLNHGWTFAQHTGHGPVSRRVGRYVIVQSVSIALSTVIVAGLVTLFPAYIAKALSVPIVFIWNYTASKLWVFRPEPNH